MYSFYRYIDFRANFLFVGLLGQGCIMPLLIAALVYGVFAILLIAIVMVIGLAQGRRPGRTVFAGALGSLAGFLFGFSTAVMMCIVAPGIGGSLGATALVVPASLVGALMGAAAGVAAVRRSKGLDRTDS